MLIGYYVVGSQIKEARNTEFPYHVLYNYDKDWEINSLKQRGLLGNRRCHREAHPHEIASREGYPRAMSYKYRDLDSLIEDERRAETDEAVIQVIVTALRGGR